MHGFSPGWGQGGIVMAEPTAGLLFPPRGSRIRSRHRTYVRLSMQCTNPGNFSAWSTTTAGPDSFISPDIGFRRRSLPFWHPHGSSSCAGSDVKIRVTSSCRATGPTSRSSSGTPNRRHQRRLWKLSLKATANHRNFVIGSGCDLPPGTPAQNLEAFYETVRNTQVS